MENNNITLRINILGYTKSGKTSILERYCDKTFNGNITTNLGVNKERIIKRIGNFNIKLIIFDFCGLDRYKSLQINNSKIVDGIIFVYDITKNYSFEQMKNLVEDINNFNKNYLIIIFANKCDKEYEKEIKSKELEEFSFAQNMKFFETSAETGYNIEEAFTELIYLILRKKGIKEIMPIENSNELTSLEFKNLNKYTNLDKMKKEKEIYDFRIALLGNNNSEALNSLYKYSDYSENNLGIKIMEEKTYIIKLILYKRDSYESLKIIGNKVDGIIFIFNLISKESFKIMQKLVIDVKLNYKSNSEYIICTNKSDLDYKDKLTYNDIENFGFSQNIQVLKINYKNRNDINELFDELMYLIIKKTGNKKLISKLKRFSYLKFKNLNKYYNL